MSKFHSYSKLLIVFLFISTALFLSFKGTYSESVNGIIAGIALIEAFVIFDMEMKK